MYIFSNTQRKKKLKMETYYEERLLQKRWIRNHDIKMSVAVILSHTELSGINDWLCSQWAQ